MRKLKTDELNAIYDECRDLIGEVKVTDFESAQLRCKQMIYEQHKKKLAEQKRKQRQKPEVRQKEYEYQGKLLRGEINPPCAERTRQFVAVMTSKYGSVAGYHDAKVISEDEV